MTLARRMVHSIPLKILLKVYFNISCTQKILSNYLDFFRYFVAYLRYQACMISNQQQTKYIFHI